MDQFVYLGPASDRSDIGTPGDFIRIGTVLPKVGMLRKFDRIGLKGADFSNMDFDVVVDDDPSKVGAIRAMCSSSVEHRFRVDLADGSQLEFCGVSFNLEARDGALTFRLLRNTDGLVQGRRA